MELDCLDKMLKEVHFRIDMLLLAIKKEMFQNITF